MRQLCAGRLRREFEPVLMTYLSLCRGDSTISAPTLMTSEMRPPIFTGYDACREGAQAVYYLYNLEPYISSLEIRTQPEKRHFFVRGDNGDGEMIVDTTWKQFVSWPGFDRHMKRLPDSAEGEDMLHEFLSRAKKPSDVERVAYEKKFVSMPNLFVGTEDDVRELLEILYIGMGDLFNVPDRMIEKMLNDTVSLYTKADIEVEPTLGRMLDDETYTGMSSGEERALNYLRRYVQERSKDGLGL